MSEFSKIAIVGRPAHVGVIETVGRLIRYLADKSVAIVIDEVIAEFVQDADAQVFPREEIAAQCDMVVVVGGDGSILSMAKFIVAADVPVIGVNRGRLGFLTDVLPDEIEDQMAQVLAGEYEVENRFLLNAYLHQQDSLKPLGSALNDVILHPGKAAQMIEFELYVNDRFVYSQESDGMIVATPTGSTAYALSAGGPIMHPGLNAVVLVPMYPHSLSSRPIVVDGDSEIRLVVSAKESLQPQLSCDGAVVHPVAIGDAILIKKMPSQLRLMHPIKHDYYQSCRSKLGWGSRLVTS